MKKEIEKILKELTESRELEVLGIPNASLQEMISYGKKLFPFPKDEKKEINLVTKCMSTVHLVGTKENGKMNYLATSNSAFVRSELYFITLFFNGLSPEEILSEKIKKEYNETFSKLQELVPMSMNRQQGFEGAYERIIEIAKKNL